METMKCNYLHSKINEFHYCDIPVLEESNILERVASEYSCAMGSCRVFPHTPLKRNASFATTERLFRV